MNINLCKVKEFALLQVLIAINDLEDDGQLELQTITGRNLYFRTAAKLINNSVNPTKQIKSFTGRQSDRAMRQRMREFELQGLINIGNKGRDKRTKNAVPTEKFINQLNEHLALIREICNSQFLMIEKH
jgi:hypothetical protein